MHAKLNMLKYLPAKITLILIKKAEKQLNAAKCSQNF